jgi:hypothetical protein
LYLSKGGVYMKTLLERAKGSALDITVGPMHPVDAIALLPPHTKQIRCLDFVSNHWADIRRFSEVNSGPLPLLTTLRIDTLHEFNLGAPDWMTPPLLLLFNNAVNLKEFLLHSEGCPFLSHFVFPNLTAFELSTMPAEGFHASQLLNFLEASTMLQTVDVKIIADLVVEGIPRERVVVLPNVEIFRLVVSDGGPGYEIAAHISCPSARDVSLMHEICTDEIIPQEIFPSSDSWNAITRQYTRSSVEEVEFGIQGASDPVITCSLTFRSPDATAIRLDFKAAADDEYDEDFFEEMYYEVFSQASRTIQDHPQLANVRRLHLNHHSRIIGYTQRMLIADEVGGLFKAVGPLDELTIDDCDLRSHLIPFLDLQGLFPTVKELTILHPLPASRGACEVAIVRLAGSQHALGVPFERVTVRMENLPAAMAEVLGPWVGAAYCYDEPYI